MNPAIIGVGLTGAVTAISWMTWGRAAALPALVMGLVAMGIQVLAHRLMRRPANPKSPFPAGWLAGTGLRLGGIVVMVLLVVLDRERFAPLPAALGYLGVLIPLLMLELRKTT